MSDGLIFEHPFDLPSDFLPYNYFPAAFGLVADRPDPMNRIVLVLPGEAGGRRSSVEYHVMAHENLTDAALLEKFLDERGFDRDSAFERCFLGPPTRLDETAVGQARQMQFDTLEFATEQVITQVAVIIDIGIAFWNPVFRSQTGPRFKAMRYLDFDAFSRGQPALEPLSANEIDGFCRIADIGGGQDRIVAALGARFPDSYFGAHGAAEPGTLWHGTAMADLMAGLPHDAPDTTALMGIELPMTVLRNADGDSLGAALTVLLEGALEMTASQFSGVPLVVALPWGFTGGPQDGSHPFAMEIDRVLAMYPDRSVKFLLPMGNQMQDRCCAHILPSSAGEPENTVIWQLPPDDFSENSAEFNVVSTGVGAMQTVRLTAPTGETAVILLKEAQGMKIRRDGVVIGGLVRSKDIASGPRLRLVFGPTGWQAGTAKPAFAGNWTLSFHQRDEVRIWVLRDDRDWALDKALPRRASRLFDQNYRERDAHDAYLLTDSTNSTVVRAGTASVLATARSAIAVQADETLGTAKPQPAWYSGSRTSGRAAERAVTIDTGRHNAGVLAAANGTAQRVKVSGTSAAIALAARAYLGLPARPA